MTVEEAANKIFGLWVEAGRPGIPEWGVKSIAAIVRQASSSLKQAPLADLVEPICRAICKVEALNPDEPRDSEQQPNWVRYADPVLQVLLDSPRRSEIRPCYAIDGEQLCKDDCDCACHVGKTITDRVMAHAQIEGKQAEPPSQPERCPSCGYTEEDAKFNMDHHLCRNAGKVPWEVAESPSQASKQPPKVDESSFINWADEPEPSKKVINER